MRKIPVIIGPTCSGKTDIALKIAKATNSHIISIDSRQVFRSLDIGTGKIKSNSFIVKHPYYWEVDGVKIFGYDIYNLNEELNVLKFSGYVKGILEEMPEDNFVITCGTGFYLNFLMGNQSFSEINQQRKEELDSFSLEELNSLLDSLGFTGKIDRNNKPRLITKILTLENPNTENNFKIENTEFKIYYLKLDRKILYENADEFIEDIFFKNVVGEYLDALNNYGYVRSLDGLIYKEIGKYLQLEITYDEAIVRSKFDMHAYIRRQETYFKKFTPVLITSDKDQIISEIIKILN